jgi:GGDEF domain-containing protein
MGLPMLSSGLPDADDREHRYLDLTDDLTCLYNRRGFFAAATHQPKAGAPKCAKSTPSLATLITLKRSAVSSGHGEGDLAIV